MENLVSNLKQKITGGSSEANSNEFRKLQVPDAKVGLGSTEADLLSMVRKYLEVVGLVVLVWLIGERKKEPNR